MYPVDNIGQIRGNKREIVEDHHGQQNHEQNGIDPRKIVVS